MFTKKNKKTLTYDQALNRAAQLCSKGEQCPSDIFEKVQEWGLSESEAARLVAYLTQEKYLDEARFVHAFVNDKFTYQHWGRIKIAYMLRMKGIADSLIENTLDDVISPESYLDTCVDLVRTKVKGMDVPLCPADRAKVFRFAGQRGFESSVVSKALSRLSIPDED